MDIKAAQALVASFPHWHHSMEIFPGVQTPGAYNADFLLDKIQPPERLDGKTVLDIGACDGYFTRDFAQRGATVTAVDYRHKSQTGFHVMEKIEGREYEHVNANIYDLPDLKLPKYDIVLFLGVLYHLPDPLKALDIVHSLCAGEVYMETYAEDFGVEGAVSRYYPSAELAGDITNFFAPNTACVRAWMEDAGFEIIRLETWGDRCLVHAKAGPRTEKMRLAYGLIS